MKRRVVITGLGIVSSIGIGKDTFWKNLVSGRSGITDVDRFDVSNFSIKKAGEIKGFKPDDFMPSGSVKKIGRGSQLAIAATSLVFKDAGLSPNIFREKRSGLVVGTTMGESPSIEMIDRFWTSGGEENVYMSNVANFPVNNLSNNIGFSFSVAGLNLVVPTACAAGNYSIGFAADLISRNKCDLLIAGGADPLSRLAFTGFNRLFAMAPEKCQPFDKNRKGMMLGEGATVLLIEALESAKKRKAHIYAEILGYGLSCDAYNMTIPNVDGIEKVMRKALINAGIGPGDVDYISAHGTGTPANDNAECEAIHRVFGAHSKDLAVSSIKSMLGHTMGTASAIEAAACCMALETAILPPTINVDEQDEDCDIFCIPNKAVKKQIRVALNNSFAFGGNNACLVLGVV
ncbi:MAG: beta-ketoacyl-[acyl-carrier-protein] synthase family protein [Candidatus Omnitrophica bacterium]|nr:beta-ketoacyl-[acyl-carrier-protein] synthase family protein [Candidatus Omnitrophota bacterium]MDD5487924.1 beta-ketoacyl-[acyl-carrier-protein] synthase family protein [Candidatus Omnitrophota bacterium]